MTRARTAVVTGAGSGLGRAVARTLMDDGWNVVGVGRNADRLRESFDGYDESAQATFAADVTDAAEVEAVFAATMARFGRVDFLFNNAGVHGPWVPFEKVLLDDWEETIEINITGAFLCAQAAYRIMKSQGPAGGRILNNGSVSAHVPRPNSAPYTASKSAMTGLTRAIALEGRAFGIACGQVDFGNVRTDMTTDIAAGVLQADLSVKAEATIDVSVAAHFVLMIAGMPPTVNLLGSTLLATEMPFSGRG